MSWFLLLCVIAITAQKMKDFFSKCDQNRSFLRIWSHLLKKSFMENFFCAVYEPITILPARSVFTFQIKFFVVSIYYHIFLNHFIPLVSYCTAWKC